MSEAPQNRPIAWEPLTPQGVAAFARASFGRVLLVQLIVALLAAAVIGWFLHSAWFPVVRSAIQQLPDTGQISHGQLDWPGESPRQLAANQYLGLAVDLNHSGRLGREAHLQVEFGRKDFRLLSLPGYRICYYPPDSRLPFNRTALAPLWGAWEPWLLTGAILGTVLGLMLVWLVLTSLYCLPVWLITLFQNRDLNLRESWRLAAAALMPGALFLIFGIFTYGIGLLDLLRLGVLCGLHFVIGWVYLVISPLFLPKRIAGVGVKGNPFASTGPGKPTAT
jgi:hypothetical protein